MSRIVSFRTESLNLTRDLGTISTETMGIIGFLQESIRIVRNISMYFGKSLAEANKASFNSLDSVSSYADWRGLLEPEKKILNLLRSEHHFRRLLDIGVGGGRTTEYFAGITEEYIGIDYSENMVKACRSKFQNNPAVSIAVLDARNLSVYPDNYFDIVLFSNGGLDCVGHEDRISILHEIHRVVRNVGFFCFSTSNLDAMLQYCRIDLNKNLRVFTRKVVELLLTRFLNSEMWDYSRGKRSNLKYTMFIIGTRGDWRTKTYCTTLDAQFRQLKDSGFENIRVYDLHGKEIQQSTDTADVELYFLCNVRKW
jgi:ubiquinone/menaquinone biosynthesis C-methylase UbiE